VFGDALQETVMQRARFGFVRTVVALTANRTLNSVFVSRARDRFGVPNGLVAASETGVGLLSEQVDNGEAKIAFEGPHDVERWDVRGRRGDIEVCRFVLTPTPAKQKGEETISSGGMSERFVMLAVERNGAMLVMDGRWDFKESDLLSVALHVPEREDALRELASQGWHPLVVTDGAGADEESDSATLEPVNA
jgi:hypothetical protein